MTKLDRLGRSLEHLIDLSNQLQTDGVDLVVLDQGIDTSTAVRRMSFQILGAIAEFEHALMSEAGQLTVAQIATEFGVTRPPSTATSTDSTNSTLNGRGDVAVVLLDIGGYGAGVSVMYSADEPAEGRRHPLARGASPEAIAAALLPEDRSAFLTEYADALAAARESLDLTGLFQMLEHWRRLAALQADPQVFRRVARRAAQLLTGQPSPDDEPLAVTRQKAGGI